MQLEHLLKSSAMAALAAVIRELHESPGTLRAMAARARAAFEREWDEPIALARWREVIASVEAQGRQ